MLDLMISFFSAVVEKDIIRLSTKTTKSVAQAMFHALTQKFRLLRDPAYHKK